MIGRVPAVMVQGTASHVGKSLVCAALCRIFLQAGYRVAPFKAQNMSLNSAAADGGEIGRAQAVQAAACRRPATVDMNPVLLKPTGGHECQIVVQGQPKGRSSAREYGRYPDAVASAIRESYTRLSATADVMVIEGAGSPAEINLLDRDFANMWMAGVADAPVLLVGDIERGGVFAALYGTWMLAPQRERIRAFLVNKFRGEVALLQPGLERLQALTAVPTIGVVPYHAPRLPEEDSLALPATAAVVASENAALRIGVLRFPHISNFTDFQPLAEEAGVELLYIWTPAEASQCDVLILPGTKSTVADLEALRHGGLDAAVRQAAMEQRKPVLGICGGYQMLGGAICDPGGIESPVPETKGLGLLPVHTRFEPEKRVGTVRGAVCQLAVEVEGYFIQHGRVVRAAGAPLLQLRGPGEEDELEGCLQDRVWGTSVHGLFNRPGFRHSALTQWRAWAGKVAPAAIPSDAGALDQRLDEWAAHLRRNMDLGAIFAMAGLESKHA